MKNILLLASQSQSRHQLLSYMKVPFVQIEQEADEAQCDWGLPLKQLVESIAQHKMNHALLPNGCEKQEIFVLTADTLTQTLDGELLGKPRNKEQAITMLKAVQHGARVGTAFCLEKKMFQYDQWQIIDRLTVFVESNFIFNVPDRLIDEYLQKTYALQCSGAIMIEEYGAQFLQTVEGSYTTIIGLPLFELREALVKIDFF